MTFLCVPKNNKLDITLYYFYCVNVVNRMRMGEWS